MAASSAELSAGGTESLRLGSPATIAGAIQFDMRSGVSGRMYRIYVFQPLEGPPPTGYPVMYVTDGNTFFCTAAMQAEMMQSRTLIVGVGYPTDDRKEPDRLRLWDLTWNAPTVGTRREYAAYLDSQDSAYGGADEYFRFLREEVEPIVAANYRVDLRNRAIFGDSLGGLFALRLLLKHPGAFRTYVAGSPSIWWNDKEVLRELPAFRRRVEAQEVSPRVLIAVGALEQSIEGIRIPEGMEREGLERMIREARMVDNARELASALYAIRGSEGYVVEYHVFESETHQSVVAAAISRAIRFSLKT